MDGSRKKISICIPCYNEQNNIEPMVNQLMNLFDNQLNHYDYSIMFIDNKSTDETRKKIEEMCCKYKKVRAIFNIKNFKYESGYYGLLQAGGDCTISIPADFQVPLEIIPNLVKKWEEGSVIVCAVKQQSKECMIMWKVRQLFYQIYEKMSDVSIIKNFTGAGLYDKEFINFLKTINDSIPSLIQLILTHGWNVSTVEYIEQKRRSGKTSHSLFSLLSIAILRITNISTIIPRFMIAFGLLIAIISFVVLCGYIALKFLCCNGFASGILPVLFGVFFFGSIQLIFLGLLGEYIMKINIRVMHRPLVVEEKRINF